MLDLRRRRWASINPALAQCVVCREERRRAVPNIGLAARPYHQSTTRLPSGPYCPNHGIDINAGVHRQKQTLVKHWIRNRASFNFLAQHWHSVTCMCDTFSGVDVLHNKTRNACDSIVYAYYQLLEDTVWSSLQNFIISWISQTHN